MSRIPYKKCAKCGATPSLDYSVHFHKFPKPGPGNLIKATAWATFCWPERDWSSIDSLQGLFRQSKYLCGRHFDNSCYNENNKKWLKQHSVPGSKEDVVNLLETLRKRIPTFVQQYSQTETTVKRPRTDNSIVEDVAVTGLSTQQSLPSTSVALKLDTVAEPSTQQKAKGILRSIDKNKVADLTENERKLYSICKNKMRSICKLKRKLKGKPKKIKIENICDDDNVQKLLDLKLSNACIILLQSQLKNCKRHIKGRRYTMDQKLLALTLYKKSPATYRLLRRIFTLPCQSSLMKLLNRVPMKTGINPHIFEALKSMAQSQTEEENYCSLIFDEMSIRRHLNYNSKTDIIDGFQDHDNHGRTAQTATNALVFMLCGVRKKWKQPIAFYLSGKSTTADRLAVIIKEVISECFKTGLHVVATICDLSTVNSKALRNLGSTTNEPYFVHEGHEIVTIADPPHLLKCTRNMFLAHNINVTMEIQLDGKKITGTAKWEHIKQFYERDQMNPNFVFAPALTDRHINPNTKQKMRVKLAAQVVSHTVSAGMLAKVATNELPVEATATATLLKKFDSLFDALNGNSPDARRGKRLSTNLTARSPHLIFFNEMKKFILDMQFVNTRNPPSQAGWIQTINAVERLWKNLQKVDILSLSTRSLNQDPLENFFGCVRYNSGSNCNPTIAQFISGFKTAIMSNLRNTGKNKNCEDDDGILNNNFKTFLTSSFSTDESSYSHLDELLFEDIPEIETTSSEIQACAYVCGFIIRKLKTECHTCLDLLTSEPGNEPAHIFVLMKEYENHKNSLNYASYYLVIAVEKIASLTKKYLNENLHGKNLKQKAMLLLKTECGQEFVFLQKCIEHYEILVEKIINHCFMISLKRHITLKNREFSEEETKKSLERKLKILKNK